MAVSDETWIRAAELLGYTAGRPSMFVSTKEALMARVTAILDMVHVPDSGTEFYARHLKMRGNMYLNEDLQAPPDAEWAAQVARDALAMLRKAKKNGQGV